MRLTSRSVVGYACDVAIASLWRPTCPATAIVASILVVATDPDLLGHLRRLLTDADHRVITADSFEDGKRALTRSEPDCLIVTVRLEAFNGLHLVLRASNVRPHLGSIVLDSSDDAVLRTEAARLGALWVAGPDVAGRLNQAVSHVLARGGGENPSWRVTQ